MEKIPIVDDQNNIIGLATEKDLAWMKDESRSNTNFLGKLFVAAAIGCWDDYLEWAEALVSQGCDGLVVDVANGHN